MLSLLKKIVCFLCPAAAIAYFFVDYFDYIKSFVVWSIGIVAEVLLFVPGWLLVFCYLALGLAVASLIVKLL